ncbi:class I SAM-dependent methyltransferase [Rhizobium sp.]
METIFDGYCPLCEQDVKFEIRQPGVYRSTRCPSCETSPRHRALWVALNSAFPSWRDLAIHEGSAGWDRVSRRLAEECADYTASQFLPDYPAGHLFEDTNLPGGAFVVQNLEEQTFASGAFDLVITLDVFEHLFDPLKAIREIARTLRPGGATLMTVPVVNRFGPSRRRARELMPGIVKHLLPAEYHGNPVSEEGSLVTIDWGYDIAAQLAQASGMYFVMQTFENPDFGIRDECNQILIGYKAPLPDIG